MSDLDEDIAAWRTAVTRGPAVDAADADELESHLRDQVADLVEVGLSDSEAFQIAVQRLGRMDALTAEFAREHAGRLWKQLDLAPVTGTGVPRIRPFVGMIVFALIAAAAAQVARLVASTVFPGEPWLPLNLGFFVLPVLAGYFVWRRGLSPRVWVPGAASIVLLAVAVNLFPFAPDSQGLVLAAIHIPVVLWLVIVGLAYLGGQRPTGPRRMEFVRFTGEWAIYWVLLALGGGVLTALTVLVVTAIAPDAGGGIIEWVIPSGGAAAVVVAAWLVEAKQSVVENLAPVLTAIFTPLFAAMLLVASIVYVVGGGIGREFDRELLTVFDVVLLVVLALVLYALSARDATKPAGVLDALRLVAVAAALLVDLLVLGSMIARIAEYGLTPNRVVAIGLNLILVVNLGWTAWLSARMLAKRGTAVALERWQTDYLPVFAVWALGVVVVLPLAFGFA